MAELNYCPVCGNVRNADGGCYMCGLHPKETEGPHMVNMCPYCLASGTRMAKLLEFRAQVKASEDEHDQ